MINLVELLKDCPRGMELECTTYENVSFDKISSDKKATYPIYCYITDEKGNRSGISFTENGCESKRYGAKCVIFPKGKNTWEGFQRPFKDGDIIYTLMGSIAIISKTVTPEGKGYCAYCGLFDNMFDTDIVVVPERLAIEEEKEKLFKAIKDNGYQWNAEIKTLEKLINKNKFVVGATITNGKTISKIVSRDVDSYKLEDGNYVFFNEVHKWELAPNKFDINSLILFESKVLVRDSEAEKWRPAIWGYYNSDSTYNYPYEVVGGYGFSMCIPYEGNEHLLKTTKDCEEYYKTWK